jgi:LacI family transcriptional regulator
VQANLSSVAAHAQVSTSTASRALSGHPAVLPATRERVLAAAAELHYQPNRMASALRTSRSGLLGLVVNNLRINTFHTIAETLQRWAGAQGYQVLVCTTGGDPAREAAFLQTARTHQLDGVVVAGSGANADLVNRILAEGRAVVTMNRDVPGSLAPSVLTDHETAARLATEHLLALGHTRIAAIEGPPEITSGRLHHAGFTSAMSAAGVHWSPNWSPGGCSARPWAARPPRPCCSCRTRRRRCWSATTRRPSASCRCSWRPPSASPTTSR